MKRYLAVAVTLLALAMVTAAALAQAPSGPSTGTGYPAGSIAVTSSATGTTGAVVATLAGAPGRLTYICGLYVSGNTTTTANVTAVTIAGTIGGSITLNVAHPVSPALSNLFLPDLTPCIPASALNTAITVTSAADAAGVNVAVSAWGYTAPSF